MFKPSAGFCTAAVDSFLLPAAACAVYHHRPLSWIILSNLLSVQYIQSVVVWQG